MIIICSVSCEDLFVFRIRKFAFYDDIHSSNVSYFAAKETTYTDCVNIERVMKGCISNFELSSGGYCYKRYEILMDNDQFQIFEAKYNNNIPDFSFLYPLCKIHDTAQNILPNAELNAKTPGLITVAFTKCHDRIRIDLLISDGGQLYGKRISKDDLTNKIPALFQNSQISQSTRSLIDKLEFANNSVYNRSLAHRLPHFVGKYPAVHDRLQLGDISKLKTCFDDHNIDDRYIQKNTVKEFRDLLAHYCGVSAGAATALWHYLREFDQDNHPNLGIYSFSHQTESKNETEKENHDEDEHCPIQDDHMDFYATLYEMYPEYYAEEDFDELPEEKDEMLANNQVDDHKQDEIVNTVQYGFYSYSSKQVIKDDDNDDYVDESLSTPWSDDEDNESDVEFEIGLSPPPSDWDSDENTQLGYQSCDKSLDLEMGESLSTPSEWEDEAISDIVFPGNAVIFESMSSHEAMANWLIIRYLLFYERYISEFYPSQKL